MPSACSMPKFKLGRSEFDVDSKEINASRCGVSDADWVAFAKSINISRVNRLYLVRFIK